MSLGLGLRHGVAPPIIAECAIRLPKDVFEVEGRENEDKRAGRRIGGREGILSGIATLDLGSVSAAPMQPVHVESQVTQTLQPQNNGIPRMTLGLLEMCGE